MKTPPFLKLAALSALMLAGISVAAPAQAATGNWNGFANGPTLYQTMWQYDSQWMSPPDSVPASALMTGASWVVNCNSYPTGIAEYLHIPSYGYYQLPSISGYVGASGIPAKQSMRFSFYIWSNPPRVIAPVVCGGHQLSVYYQY